MLNKLVQRTASFSIVSLLSAALILAVNSQDNTNSALLMQWLSFGTISGLMLWYLRSPTIFLNLIKDKAFICYLLFIIWALLSSFFWSLTKTPSILSIAVLLGGLFSYLIGYAISDKKAFVFYKVLFFGGCLLVFYTYYQSFVLGISRPSGTLSNWNGHATFMGMILMPAVIRFALHKTVPRITLTLWSVLAFLFSLAMAITLSRGAVLFLIVCFMAYILFAWRHRVFYKQAVYLLVAIILGYLSSSLLLDVNIGGRMAGSLTVDTTGGIGRPHYLWLPAWQIFLDHPFLGSGLNSFRLLYSQYRDPLSAELGFFAHNDYLQYLTELGAIGFILFMSFIVLIVRRLVLLIYIKRSNLSSAQIEAFSLLAVSIGMLVHTFLTFHLYYLTFQILWGFYLGRAAHLLREHQTELSFTHPASQKRFLFLFQSFRMALISALLIFGLSFYYLYQSKNTEVETEIIDYQWKAGLFFPALGMYESSSANRLLSLLNKESYTLELHKKMTTLALDDINIALYKVPFHAANYVTKAKVLRAMNKGASLIQPLYEQALLLNPYLLNVRDEYAHYLIEQNMPDKAQLILWDGWNRLYADRYHNMLIYLNYQLEVNKQYGDVKKNAVIEHEINRLLDLEKDKLGGQFVFLANS